MVASGRWVVLVVILLTCSTTVSLAQAGANSPQPNEAAAAQLVSRPAANGKASAPVGPGKTADDAGPVTPGTAPVANVVSPPAEAALPRCPPGRAAAQFATCQ